MDDALKTRGITYSNIEIRVLFAPHQNFWLRAWPKATKSSVFGGNGFWNLSDANHETVATTWSRGNRVKTSKGKK